MAEPTLDFAAFERSLAAPRPPAEADSALRALWYDANGRDGSAWRAVQSEGGLACARVRAYLHRKAGEDGQARVWYWKAGVSPWEGSAESEWRDIAETLIAQFPVASAYGA